MSPSTSTQATCIGENMNNIIFVYLMAVFFLSRIKMVSSLYESSTVCIVFRKFLKYKKILIIVVKASFQGFKIPSCHV